MQEVKFPEGHPRLQARDPARTQPDPLDHGYNFDPGWHDWGAARSEEQEETDGEPEPTVGSPRPLSLGGTGDDDSEGDLTPLPSAWPAVPSASSAPSRSDRAAATRQPPPPVPFHGRARPQIVSPDCLSPGRRCLCGPSGGR
ncbi:hypothetical protein ACSSS7_006692 [Eimeria intestinalis]